MASLRQKLAGAKRHQQAGRKAQAEQIYKQILRTDPNQPDALQFVGLCAYESGRVDEAVDYLQRAAKSQPSNAFIRTNLGTVLQHRGQFEEAIACYRRALEINPNLPHAHNNLGAALKKSGHLKEALESYQKAITLRPEYAEAHSNLGNVLKQIGQLDEAIAAQHRSIECNPRYAEGHNNLGLAVAAKGDYTQALECYRKALELKPDYAEAYDNAGSAMRSLGDSDNALRAYEQAVKLDPNFSGARNNLGALLQSQQRLEEAITYYREALRLDPHSFFAHSNLGDALAELGEFHHAQASYQHALAIKATPRLQLVLATQLPPIYESSTDLQRWRERLHGQLSNIDQRIKLDPETELLPSCFYMAYQGDDCRTYMETISRCYQPLNDPSLKTSPRREPNQRIRVGFISRLFKNHTIGRLMQGLIAELDRSCFEVSVISHGKYSDPIANHIRENADRYLEISDHPATSRKAVADLQLDALFYADVGMDPLTLSLAHSRLAPVQCVTWGHPVTSGSPVMDYFVSSRLIEPEGAEQQYTEKLVQLEHLPSYYHRPRLDGPLRPRAELGLPEGKHIYLCPQSLFKFHPEFDPLLAKILRNDRDGVVAIVEAAHPSWNKALADRFKRSMGDVAQRIVWVPRLKQDAFLHLLATSEVMLDPLHFGGGNTSYEGLGVGTPVVTLPSAYMRGRVTLGCYRQMELMDCVARGAEHYVELAGQLACDSEHRQAISERILAAGDRLFEDRSVVKEIEDFLAQAVGESRESNQTKAEVPLPKMMVPHVDFLSPRPTV